MKGKIDALADIAPEAVIEMYAERLGHIPAENRIAAIEYLRCYSRVYYSPDEVPFQITRRISILEVKWLEAQ